MGRVLPGRRMEAMDTSAGQNTAQSQEEAYVRIPIWSRWHFRWSGRMDNSINANETIYYSLEGGFV